MDAPVLLQSFKILRIVFLQPVATTIKFFHRLEEAARKPIQPVRLDLEFGRHHLVGGDENIIVGIAFDKVGGSQAVMPKSVFVQIDMALIDGDI